MLQRVPVGRMRYMVDLIKSFIANGPTKKHLVVRLWQEQLELTTVRGTTELVPSLKYLDTADGLRLVRIEKGRYACPESGEVFTSDDPEAP